MPLPENARIAAEQHASYRRGVVLGLTMAEVGILIIFVLLLLIGFNEWMRVADSEVRAQQVSVPTSDFEALKNTAQLMVAMREALGVPHDADPKEITTLVRALGANATRVSGQSALEDMRRAARQMADLAAEMEAKGQPESLVKAWQDTVRENVTKEGQLKYFEDQLRGTGRDERPCWVKEDGTIEYLFDVVLASEGIRMRENRFPSRETDRTALPMPESNPNETLSESLFLERTRPLFQSSLAANCRFFVTVFDSTAASEKDRYKSLLRTVEGHFYKRLSFDRAPF